MERNKKGNKYLLTRAKYKAIKAFDHQQMEQFCMDVYKGGFQDGRESVPGVDITAIMAAIGNTKGIGKVKMGAIQANIEAVFATPQEREAPR